MTPNLITTFKIKINMRNDIDNMVNTMVEFGVCTEEEFDLVSMINGYSVETVNDVLYARTGYNDYEDWFNDLPDED